MAAIIAAAIALIFVQTIFIQAFLVLTTPD